MIWYFISGFLLLVAITILVVSYIKDSKYMKSKTKDILGDELRLEIEEERELNKKKQDAFKKALEDAQK